MTDSSAAPHAAIAETHISTVMFAGDRAYKLLKPIETGFLDHREVEGRLRAVDSELHLNRRLARDIYLGTSDIYEGDQISDRLLVMRRLPEERRLTALVDSPDFSDHLRRIAHVVAAFHSGQPPIADAVRMATADGLASLWQSSLDEIATAAGPVIEMHEFEQVRELSMRYLGHAGELFDQRRAQGHTRDGHGDLTAEDIFVLDDGPRLLDCLAFDAEYRISDVLADIAFLVMDVERIAGPAAARALMGWYCEFTGEHHPPSLAHHYVAYRAHVRSKVAVLRHRQGELEQAAAARLLHRQAFDHLRRAQLRVVLVGGGPGSGKTATANALAEHVNWAVVDTDTLRKDIHHIAHDDHDVAGHPGLYDAAATVATYEGLIGQATQLLRNGICVVMDATWADERFRDLMRSAAAAHGAELHEFRCDVDTQVAQRRIDARRASHNDASDATPPLVEAFRSDPWAQACRLDTLLPVREVVDAAVREIFGRPTPDLFTTNRTRLRNNEPDPTTRTSRTSSGRSPTS